jgi:hypothetical protein
VVRYESSNVNFYYATYKIRAASVSGSNVTFTTGRDDVNALAGDDGALVTHDFIVGNVVEIRGVVSNGSGTADEFNGDWTITAVTTNTFTFAMGSAPTGTNITLPTNVSEYGRVGKVGWFTYGGSSAANPSVAPFVATVLDYDRVEVSWSGRPVGSPSEPVVKFRLLRNQQGVSETAEDGVILSEATINNLAQVIGANADPTYDDSNLTGPYLDAPAETGTPAIVEGRSCHYSIWVLLEDTEVAGNGRFFWKRVDSVSVVIPDQHNEVLGGANRTRNTHDKFMHMLPRVITSGDMNALGEIEQDIDKGGLLYNFLYGFSFTLDEMYTNLDALLPDSSGQKTLPPMVNLTLMEYGLPGDNLEFSQSRRKLARDARKIVLNKGTTNATATFVEDITGYAPTVATTVNKMLTVQDSTFYKGVGNWVASGASTIATDITEGTPASRNTIPYAVDTTYTGKVIINANNDFITNGASSPSTLGIPVVEEVEYTFSSYIKKSSGAGSATVTMSISWYDYNGAFISTSTDTYTTTDDFIFHARGSVTATAPLKAAFAVLKMAFSVAATYHVDMIQFEEADEPSVYYEARGLDLTLASTKQNYIPNPSFEHATLATGWTLTGTAAAAAVSSSATNAPSGVFTGTRSLKLTGSAAVVSAVASDIAVYNNSYWTLSAYVKASVEVNVTLSLSGVTGVASVTETTAVGTDWRRLSIRMFIPSGVVSPTVDVTIASASFTGDLFIDSVQLEPNYDARDYADGGTSDTIWIGTANNSKSVHYSAMNYKIPALVLNLPNYLPAGIPYYIKSEKGELFNSSCMGYA